MKARERESESKLDNVTQFNAVYKEVFFMERLVVHAPKPTPHYHYHNGYELYYLYSGERYYFIKDRTYHLEKGALVFIDPYTIHCSANFEESGFDRMLFNFRKEFIEKLLLALGVADPFECYRRFSRVIQLNLHERAFVETLFETMLDEYNKGDAASEAYIQTSLTQLLLFISKSEHQLESPPLDYTNPTHKIISEITGYINNNYSSDITLGSISEKFHISSCYFSRTFKKATGLSFTEYLNNVRIKEAQKFLHKTDMSILDIAETVGFKSNTHFGRVFKRIVGMSPLAFRKSTS